MNSKGFSLIEVMIVTLILSVVLGAIFALTFEVQKSFESEKYFTETAQDASVALDEIVRYIRQAGNDPTKKAITVADPAVNILSNESIIVNSDITGSFNGTQGDPDGTLASPLEKVTITYTGPNDRRIIITDQGQAAVWAENIAALNFSFFDLAGNPTADSTQVARVNVDLTALTGRRDRRTGRVNTVSFHSEVFVRSKTFNPFAK